MRRFAALFFAAAVSARGAAAAGFGLGPPEAAFCERPRGFGLPDENAARQTPESAVALVTAPRPGPSPPKLFDRKTTLVTAGIVVATPILGYLTWWHNDTNGRFVTADEGWFGEDTYAGGADKASHITLGYMAALGFQAMYRALGKTPGQARALAFGLTAITGTLVEVGDGFSKYGFAWEDIAANVIGAGIATAVDAFAVKDTVGLRFGLVPNTIPPPCCRYPGFGCDYSGEIYTLDLKLAGLLPRLGAAPGAARFFLLSATYGSKGYRHSPPENRERQVGVEIGLNLPELLRAAGVRDTTWWGKPLLVFLTYFRVPYTAFGWRYDLNQGRWRGPDTGQSYDPGLVIYD
ncbi:MAG TPA: DUF2279 domain-containing protein [Thermoanaerobaculia bacterium]|nr:DUF2279 domain-containing protein [Thermoanaerobaculia bacterium]